MARVNPAGQWLDMLPEVAEAQATGGGMFGAVHRQRAAREEQEEAARQRWMALALRRGPRATPAERDRLAPAEHGAYAEYRTMERPVYGAVEQLALIPSYEIAKKLGLLRALGLADENTSPPSLDSMAEGYRGVGRGIKNLFN